jgi:chorismate dehydratase
MTPIRLGAVDYLNARPLLRGLEDQPDRFTVRWDVPSKCAALLHDGVIDLGLIPSIEFLHRQDYCIVPDVAIASNGRVASVALFSSRPVPAIRSIALDSSSRTSAALLRVLCARWFEIEPKFHTLPPDLPSMLKRCDAALMIGDPALFADYRTAGLDKTDLGEEWTAMTGLPFVWAFWAGRPLAAPPEACTALRAARDAGVASVAEVARAYCSGDPAETALGTQYLRENIRYGLGEAEQAGLRRFLDVAAELRVVPVGGAVRFYPTERRAEIGR